MSTTSKTPVRRVLVEWQDEDKENPPQQPTVPSYPVFTVAIAIFSGAIVGGISVWFFAVASQTTNTQQLNKLKNDLAWEQKKNIELTQDKKDKCELAKKFAESICK